MVTHSLRSVRHHTTAGPPQCDWAIQLLLTPLLLRLLPPFEVFDAVHAVPAQLLAVNAQVKALPAFARKHQRLLRLPRPVSGGRSFASRRYPLAWSEIHSVCHSKPESQSCRRSLWCWLSMFQRMSWA